MSVLNLNQLSKIFLPEYFEKKNKFEENKCKFVHYTSAETAFKILTNETVWLRNSRLMNDSKEIIHGFDLIKKKLESDTTFLGLKPALDKINVGIFDQVIELFFNSFKDSLINESYISSLSEHSVEENDYGRLSMWRAYGNVALVLNSDSFFGEARELNIFTSPVAYVDFENIHQYIQKLSSSINENRQIIQNHVSKTSVEDLVRLLIWAFTIGVCSLKHKGFREEKEWRVVYMPNFMSSKHIIPKKISLSGIPQTIYQVPLIEKPEIGFNGASIPNIINKIIIGPCEFQELLKNEFTAKLKELGCKNASDKVTLSGIPLRR